MYTDWQSDLAHNSEITMMNKPGRSGLWRLVDATNYSVKGLAAAWRHEEGFRMECVLATIMLPSAIWLGSNAVERCLLIIPVLLVITVELLNSAIEAAVDRIGTSPHPLSGQAKDIGSAAVMVSMILCLISWALIIYDRFY